MTVSYQGPRFLEGIVRWTGLPLFDRADKLSLHRTKNIETQDIEAFENLKQIDATGRVDDCKLRLAKLIPEHRLSHFELAEGRCTAILK